MERKKKSTGSKGKNFERQFKLSCDQQDLLIVRLNDSDLSFNPLTKNFTRFTAKNPCDYILFSYPNIFFMELKSTEYNSISIQENIEEEKMIKLHQINSLTNLSLHEGVFAGFVLNFREKENLEEDTYFLSIQNFLKFKEATQKKSINKLDVVQYGGVKINQTLKRTQYIYHVDELLKKIQEREGKKDGDTGTNL